MRDKVVVGVALGRWQANCYLVGDRQRGAGVLIDPGEGAAQQVPALLHQYGLECEAILLTHGHLDHFWAAPDLADQLDVPVLLHPDDRWLWESPAAGFGVPPEQAPQVLEQQFGVRWDNSTDHLTDVHDGQALRFGGIDYRVAHNPGHTPGHVTYLGQDLADADVAFALSGTATPQGADVLFSGDLVFAGSIGRTDFPGGSTEQMMRSLVDTVLPLEDDTLILSGHGPDTTVGRERSSNPFLQQAAAAHS